MKNGQEEVMTEEQKKMMRTQDIGYVEMKRVAETKVCDPNSPVSPEGLHVISLASHLYFA